MDRRRSLSFHPPRTPRRTGFRIAAPLPLAVLLLLGAACGGSISIESSPSQSVSASSTASSSPSTDASATAGPLLSPDVTATSPSPELTEGSTSPTASTLSAEQQVMADYFAATEPAYNEFMNAWLKAWRIVERRAHDTMDQTWAIAAGLLAEPLARMSVARRMYRNVAPIPASLIAAYTDLGRCMGNVQTYYTMARKGYVQGLDMDNDTAYGRKMSRIAKLDQRQYRTWKQAVIEQAEQLGVPVPWSWKED